MKWLIPLALFAIFLAAAQPASAQDAAKDRAKQLAREGLTAFNAGEYEKAIDRIEAAEKEFHSVTHIVYIGRAHRALNHLVEAYNAYITVVAEKLDDNAPSSFIKSQQLASAEAAELLPRVATLRFVTSGVPQNAVEIRIGDILLKGARLLHPLAVAQGTHEVVGSATNADDVTVKVSAIIGKTSTVELTFEPHETEAPVTGRPDDTSSADSGWSGIRTGAVIAFSIGGAALVAGVITGVVSISQVDDIRAQCGGADQNDCPPNLEPDAATAETIGTVSTVLFVVGGAGVALGAVLLAVDLTGDDGSMVEVGLSPSGLSISGSW